MRIVLESFDDQIMVTVVVMGRKEHRKIGNENDCPKILALFGV